MNLLGLDPATLVFGSVLLSLTTAGVGFMTAYGRGVGAAAAATWGWAMTAMTCTFLLWFGGGSDRLFLGFLLGNTAVVLVAPLVYRATLLLVGAVPQYSFLLLQAALGLSGVVLVYFFELPRGVAVITIAATFLWSISGSIVALTSSQQIRRTPQGWLLIFVMGALGLSVCGRLMAFALFGAEAVAPMAASNAQILGIFAVDLFIVGGSLGFLAVVADQQRAVAMEKAKRDGLTGLYTRSAFFEGAIEQEAVTGRYAVFMLDVDHFKRVNDTYGHAGGDAVLRHIAAQVMRSVRSADIVGRYGGEEICVFLPDCDLAEAARVARRVCDEAAGHAARLSDGRQVPYTVSIGVASYDSPVYAVTGSQLEKVLARADDALYEAKRLGRNRVVEAEAVVRSRDVTYGSSGQFA